MATDIIFNDANINGYTDIPASLYPVLPGVALTGVAIQHATTQVADGILPNTTGVSVKWSYPVTDNLFVRVSVGYQVQVMEGTFSQVGSQSPVAPGPIVFEQIVNMNSALLPENRYINLQGGATGSANITSSALKGNVKYTVRVRALLFSELGAGTVRDQYFKYTEWGTANFRVNNIPSAVNLRVNGETNPTRISKRANISFSFTFSDTDGPAYLYRIQIGTVPGVSFAASIWDSGLIFGGRGFTSRDFIVPYTGPALVAGVTYAWRVQVQDSLSDGGWTDANDTFKINTLPTVVSIKVDGEEILFGATPTVADSGVSVTWEFDDEDGDTQRGYNLGVFQDIQVISDNFLSGESSTETQQFELFQSGNVFASTSTVALPDLPQGSEIQVKIKVRDSVEFGEEFVGAFIANARPKTLDLRIAGSVNPGNVASSTPIISWSFFDDTPGDIQRAFRVQVASNDSFTSLLWDTGEVTSTASSVTYGSTGSPVVAPAALSHGQYYYARVMLSDGTSFSEWENAFFAINTRPNSPTLLTPAAGAYSGSINVTWMHGSPLDADSDTVTYTLEITNRRSSNQGWEYLAGPFPSSTSSYALSLATLRSGTDYGIRVLSNDGFVDSDPQLGTSALNANGLGFTIENHAPSTPAFIFPTTGAVISAMLKAEWLESSPVDVDGDAVFYVLEMTRDVSVATPLYERVGVFNEGTTKTFIDVSDLPDGSNYRLRITAYDSKGGTGSTNSSVTFAIVNTSQVTDFESVDGVLFISTSDGRVYRAAESIWQVDNDFASQPQQPFFQFFVAGNPKAILRDGSLFIDSPPNSTLLMRVAPEPNE